MTSNARIALLMAALFCWGCNQFEELDDLQGVEYQADYALALVNSALTMEDLLEDFEEETVLSVGPDGVLRLQYTGDVLTRTSDDVFEEINRTLANFPLIPLTVSRQALPFSTPDGLDLDQLVLKAGDLRYILRNQERVPVDVEIRLPTVTRNGQPLVINVQMPAYSGQGDPPLRTNALAPVDLSDYIIRAENDSIYVEFSATDPDGNSVISDDNGAALNIQNLEFSYAEGYLGNIIYEGGIDTIEIDFFENYLDGSITFADPTVTFNFVNSFGVPTRSIINVFNVIDVTGKPSPLVSPIVGQGIDFPYPELDEIGQTKTTQFVFDRTNSNIDVLLSSGPTAVVYDVDALTNPDNDTDIRGFITDSSFYRVQVEVDLPLIGSAFNFEARDTFPIDFSGYESVTSAEFKLISENGVPLSADVQGYFIDSAGVVLDSLLSSEERLVGAASVDAEGNVTQTESITTFAEYSEERYDRIRPARELILRAAFSTTSDGSQIVKLRADQQIRFKLGAIISVSDL